MKSIYFIDTGTADRQRLTILNKTYNPPALAFLKDSGLKPDMSILEVGCGTGHMACDLAKYLGSSSKVIAIDNSEAHINIAKETARSAGVNNIEFHVCDVFDIEKLGINYDATYGRWTLEFTQNPTRALELMYQYLNPNGILAYEAFNMQHPNCFSYPYTSIIEQWHAIGPKVFRAYNYKLQFGFEAFAVFKNLLCKNILLRPNQAILTTPEEKSVYRLGLATSRNAILEKNIMTELEIQTLLTEFEAFEKNDTISGFYQNILISGIK